MVKDLIILIKTFLLSPKGSNPNSFPHFVHDSRSSGTLSLSSGVSPLSLALSFFLAGSKKARIQFSGILSMGLYLNSKSGNLYCRPTFRNESKADARHQIQLEWFGPAKRSGMNKSSYLI